MANADTLGEHLEIAETHAIEGQKQATLHLHCAAVTQLHPPPSLES
jgi:hypothetical protein